MRILVVSNLYPPVVRGGYEVECQDVVDHLRRNHDVEVLTSEYRSREAPAVDGVHRLLPFVPESRRGVLSAPYQALRGVRIARRALAQRRPDFIYVWNGSDLPHAALQELIRAGAPTAFRICEQWFGGLYGKGDMFTRHARGEQAGGRAVWSTLMRAVNKLPALRVGEASRADVAICWNSEYLRAAVPVPAQLRAVVEDVVHPINAAADQMLDVPRRPSGEAPVVLFVGRLSWEKGAEVAVRALAILRRERGTPAVLRIVGDGTPAERRELEALAASEGVAAHVSFAGALRSGDLHAEVAAASAWVIPSVWQEPAPMVAVEAGLARVPVVASRVGGIPELLRERSEALMFGKGDATGCAAALAETLAGGPEVDERVSRALARARELSFQPYLEHMDRFLDSAATVLDVTPEKH